MPESHPSNIAVLVHAANRSAKPLMDYFSLPSALRAGFEHHRNLSAGERKTCVREQVVSAIEAPGLLKLTPVNRVTKDRNEYLHKLLLSLRRAADGNLPSAQEEMMPAQTAPIRLEQPMKGSLHSVPGVYHSKIDRLTVRTLGREESHGGVPHHFASAFTYGSRKASRRLPTLRLTSRAALICSGVLRSGSDTLTCSRARETWRLCRFNSLLSIASIYSPSSTIPQIIASVVSIREAIEAAFCRAVRVTLVGSITPAFTKSSNSSVSALKP